MSELAEKYKQALKSGIRMDFLTFCEYMMQYPNSVFKDNGKDPKVFEVPIFGKPNSYLELSL